MRKKSVGLTNDNAKSSTSTAYQRGNNRDGSPHYVFLYSDDDDDDDNGNENRYNEHIPLQSRNNKQQKNIYPRKVEVITVTLKPEDTLQALALRYRCTISELKRINNIHKDNEIFARRIVKVPVSPFSLLTEVNKNENDQHNHPTNETTVVDNLIILDCDNDKLNTDQVKPMIVSPSTSNTNNDINNIILNSMSIDPLRNNRTNDNFEVNHSENDKLLLTSGCDGDSTAEARVIELFGCSGADWGLTWTHLLCASLLFGFVLPVIYIIFITENQPQHSNVTTADALR